MANADTGRPRLPVSLVQPEDRNETSDEPLLTSLLELADHGRPEQRLMLAMLSDALATVRRRAMPGSRRRRDEALAWFAADDREWPFSFVNVCRSTDIDASKMRRALRIQRRPA